MINLDYKSGKTIHEQIEAGLKKLIIKGVLLPHQQLPSVRELSQSLTVNPNTVQRAYKQMEQSGLIYSVKGKGNFVAVLSEEENSRRREQLYKKLKRNVQELIFLGEEETEICNFIGELYKKKEGSL